MGGGHPEEVAFDARPDHWEASDVRSSREECDEEYQSALVDGSGNHERTG